jgi:transposase
MHTTQPELIEPLSDDRIPINTRCFLRLTDDCVVVFVRGLPIFSYDANDLAAKRIVMVQLAELKVASKADIARAFAVKRLTVFRQMEKYQAGGIQALVPKKRGPKGPRVTGGRRDKVILSRKKSGESNYQIAERLGVSEFSIRQALKRMGYEEKTPVQAELPSVIAVATEDERAIEEAPPEDEAAHAQGGRVAPELTASQDLNVPVVTTFDPDPANRVMDRLLARLGLLDDAAPLFQTAQGVEGAGVLLAIPVLVTHGVFADAGQAFRGLGAAFYGLRNVVLTLLICFMRGINRPENLKHYTPSSLGQVLGLDRAPEMKTLRRKIRSLASQKRSLSFAREQMKRHLTRLSGDLLWVYIDGHVSVYSGKRKVNKHHVTRLRLSMPSVLDYWVNDANGDPLFVFSGRVRKGMVPVLRETIKELRDAGERRVITLVFDREGWSPALFAELDKMEGVRFVTYRKASRGKKLPRLAASAFEEHEMDFNGEKVKYELVDRTVRIEHGPRKKRMRLELRQVTRRTDKGKQTHVVTNDRETMAVELAHRMFSRWGQENFFKYMDNKRDFDALVTYLMEDADPERMVSNPRRTELRNELKRQRRELEKLTAGYGSRALDNKESSRPTVRGFKIANGQLGQEILQQREQVEKLEAQLKQIPVKVPLSATLEGKQPKEVHDETRRLMHVLRMSAHRAESGLRELFRPVYARWHQESRDMVRTFLGSTGDIEVAEGELRVTLNAQAAPHRTRVLAHLCSELNTLGVKFPGSDLVLRFAVHEE